MRVKPLVLVLVLVLGLVLAGCNETKTPHVREGDYVAHLQRDAAKLAPLATSPFAKRFLGATRTLPTVPARALYKSRDGSHVYSAAERAALPPTMGQALLPMRIDEAGYYDGDVSNPLHYVRPLEVVAARGLVLDSGSRVFDFGYGSIGHLRMLASLGLDVTGVEVRDALRALYSARGDTGLINRADGGSPMGRLRLLHGFFPKDAELTERAGTGYDLVVSKNVLKKGYIHPDRPAPEDRLIHLGVDDETFVHAFHELVKPGGRVLLYNIYIPIPPEKPFLPMSDGRSPFPRETWEHGGFELEAFDEDDSDGIRKLIAIARDEGDDFDVNELHALFTIARRLQ